MNMLVSYVKDNKGHRIGCVVAIEKGMIGYSLCCKRDKFSKELGLQIATQRAKLNRINAIPHSIQDDYNKMYRRSILYFKK
jgi:hypothetical protein